MNNDKTAQPKDILAAIDKLYNEETREEALEQLSQMKCKDELRTTCLYNCFGVITILQEEILSLYKYLHDPVLEESVMKRACNVLTILHSLIRTPIVAQSIVSSNMLYFLKPLIECESEAFINIRKLCFAVIFEITAHKDAYDFIIAIINQGILNSCLEAFERVDMNEKNTIVFILQSVLKNEKAMQYIFSKQITSNICISFLINCGTEAKKEENDSSLLMSWKQILQLLYESGKKDISNYIHEQVRRVTEGR